jgi:enoyl-CoA hydratase
MLRAMEPLTRVGDVAVLRLQGGKANAMTPELLESLVHLIDLVEESDARAIVLTGYDRFFSGGLALPLLVPLDRERMRGFIGDFNATMLRVLTCPLPVVAAINGHAIAGGCVLALQADARLIADGDFKIGLNEVQLGIGLPLMVVETLRLRVPSTSLGPIALEGQLFSPERAHALGLVDEIVAPAELEARALARAAELAQLPALAFRQIKSALLRPTLDRIAASAEAEAERWLDTWFSPAARERLGEAVDRLGKKEAR